jgi:hypothetical protein
VWIILNMDWMYEPHKGEYLSVDTEGVEEIIVVMEHDKLNVEVV